MALNINRRNSNATILTHPNTLLVEDKDGLAHGRRCLLFGAVRVVAAAFKELLREPQVEASVVFLLQLVALRAQ